MDHLADVDYHMGATGLPTDLDAFLDCILEEPDVSTMVQGYMATPKPTPEEVGRQALYRHRSMQLTATFSLLQGALELVPGKCSGTPNLLRNRMESRYSGHLTMDQWSASMQEGHAMLVGIMDEFVQIWWKKIRGALLALDAVNLDLVGTPLVSTPEWPEADVLEPEQVHDEVSVENAQLQYEEHQQALVRGARQEWQEYQRELSARQHQQWEDWAVYSELGSASKRTRVDVSISSDSGSSSSTAVRLPLPRPGRSVNFVVKWLLRRRGRAARLETEQQASLSSTCTTTFGYGNGTCRTGTNNHGVGLRTSLPTSTYVQLLLLSRLLFHHLLDYEYGDLNGRVQSPRTSTRKGWGNQ